MLKPITRPLPRSADTNGARRAPFTWSSATVRWHGHGRGMVKKTWGVLVTVDAFTSVEECAASGWAGWGRAHRTRPLTSVGPEGCPDRRVR